MKEIRFEIYSRAELQAKYDKACARVEKVSKAIAEGKELSQFGEYCFNADIARINEYGRYLCLGFDEYVFHGKHLVEPAAIRYIKAHGKSPWDISAQYSNINALFPAVVDDDRTRRIAARIKLAERIALAYLDNCDAWFVLKLGKGLHQLTFAEGHMAVPREVYMGLVKPEDYENRG